MESLRTLRIVPTSRGFETTIRSLAHLARALQLLVIFYRRTTRQILHPPECPKKRNRPSMSGNRSGSSLQIHPSSVCGPGRVRILQGAPSRGQTATTADAQYPTVGNVISHGRPQSNIYSRLLTSGIGKNSPGEQSAGTSTPNALSSFTAGGWGAGTNPGAGLLGGGVGGLLGSPPFSGLVVRRTSEPEGVVSSATSLSGDGLFSCRRDGMRGSMG